MIHTTLPRVAPRRPLIVLAVAVASAAGVSLAAAPTAAAAPSAQTHHDTGRVTVVASGLDNPRGLAFDSWGRLYVAEAGHGGSLCLPGGGEEGPQCAGLTSGISVVGHGRHYRVVDGLISLAGPDGTAAEGAVAVATKDHRYYAQIGANSRALPADLPAGPVPAAARKELGRTIAFTRDGRWWPIASTGNADYDWTAAHKNLQPDQFPDANPNGLTVRGGKVYVADAGANLLSAVGHRGRVSQVRYFKVPKGSPTDAVPTCVANARDGSFYVGELLGGNPEPGHARVWQVWPNGRAAVKWTGFTGIQGCGFDERGNFYVTEFQANGMFGPDPHGAVIQIRRDGTRTTFGVGSLFFPSGFAYRGGKVYVSNWSIATATGGPASNGQSGQVVAIDVRH